jgi:hypothetical protein
MFQLGNRLWHTDSSFKHLPALASLLYARTIPPIGGQSCPGLHIKNRPISLERLRLLSSRQLEETTLRMRIGSHGKGRSERSRPQRIEKMRLVQFA